MGYLNYAVTFQGSQQYVQFTFSSSPKEAVEQANKKQRKRNLSGHVLKVEKRIDFEWIDIPQEEWS